MSIFICVNVQEIGLCNDQVFSSLIGIYNSYLVNNHFFQIYIPLLFACNLFLFILFLLMRERRREGRREKERERERERNTHLLFYLFMKSLVDSCMCHDWDWNSQPWCIRTILEQTELPDQDPCNLLLNVSLSSAPGRPALCDFAGVV